jgi:hypothetical protein
MRRRLVFLIAFVLLARPVWAGEREALVRSFSANRALLERFTAQSRSGGLVQSEREKFRQKILVLDNANDKIVLQLVRDAPPRGESDTLGANWLMMPFPDQERFVMACIFDLEERDIRLARSAVFYTAAIRSHLIKDASWEARPVRNLLLYTALKEEPASRDALEAHAFGQKNGHYTPVSHA